MAAPIAPAHPRSHDVGHFMRRRVYHQRACATLHHPFGTDQNGTETSFHAAVAPQPRCERSFEPRMGPGASPTAGLHRDSSCTVRRGRRTDLLMPRVSVIYYSSTGTNYALANAVAEGARSANAELRVRRVAETAPDAAIDSNPKWRAFADSMRTEPVATAEDVEWADAVVFGTPTRFGNVASQLKAFLDTLGGLWFHGKLANKVYSGFTSAMNPHGGQETTLL